MNYKRHYSNIELTASTAIRPRKDTLEDLITAEAEEIYNVLDVFLIEDRTLKSETIQKYEIYLVGVLSGHLIKRGGSVIVAENKTNPKFNISVMLPYSEIGTIPDPMALGDAPEYDLEELQEIYGPFQKEPRRISHKEAIPNDKYARLKRILNKLNPWFKKA